MKRACLLGLMLAAALYAQEPKIKQPPPQQEPPEEDQASAPKEYAFNPLRAENDVKVGNYYFKGGKYKAAALRFTEATRWNPSFAVAYLRLGDAEEKLKDKDAAKLAYAKYLELAPDAKDAELIRKKIGQKSAGKQ